MTELKAFLEKIDGDYLVFVPYTYLCQVMNKGANFWDKTVCNIVIEDLSDVVNFGILDKRYKTHRYVMYKSLDDALAEITEINADIAQMANEPIDS